MESDITFTLPLVPSCQGRGDFDTLQQAAWWFMKKASKEKSPLSFEAPLPQTRQPLPFFLKDSMLYSILRYNLSTIYFTLLGPLTLPSPHRGEGKKKLPSPVKGEG
ncbi:MAG: hypothetical protein HY887_10410 [Deltaproteobacteria bacterium]|nr:hypothetical protein [Deltaproteobacteria bacterium]